MLRTRLCAHLIVATALCSTPLAAQNGGRGQVYSLASINGEFALVGSYTGGTARQLGLLRFDGGAIDGFLRVNVPGAVPTERLVVRLPFAGEASVAEDGTGVASLRVTYPDGSLRYATIDFLITATEKQTGNRVATTIEYMQRETPDLMPGALIVGTLTRRSD